MSAENRLEIEEFSLAIEGTADEISTKNFKTSEKENFGSETIQTALPDVSGIRTTGAKAEPATPGPTTAVLTDSDTTDGNGSDLKFSSPANGTYKIIKTLGKGNFAKVKLALHVPTGREVAIKVIDKTQLNSSAKQKLYREVRIMKLLNHPNIVRLFQVIETDRTLYLVMEYASRGELFDHLVKNGRMRERDARAIFRQLVSAIQYCHSKFVVHRDLKAENLLLDQHMNIKIADFGFGNTFDPKSQLETFCGSPPYAAPELFMGRKYAGPEVDAWSLGVVLYTLVSGSLPFDGGTLKELRERVLRGKYRVPYYISMDCENLMRKFLVLNPAKRTTLNAVMADKWINIGYDDNDRLRAYREKPMELQDPVRLTLLVSLGYKRRDVEASLAGQLFDDIYCSYMLLGASQKSKAARQQHDSPASEACSSTLITGPSVTTTTTMALPLEKSSRGATPTAGTAARGSSGVPPAKPTRRSAQKSAPQTPQGKRSNVEVKPTLLSAQRQMAQAQKLVHTPQRFQYAGAASSRRPSTLYEKAEPAAPKSPMGEDLMERLQIANAPLTSSADKPFPRNNVARATFHFGQGRSGKQGRGAAAGEEDSYQTPPLSADDTKPASRVGFFSKLTARFGRRVIHLHEKDAAEQRKNVTK